MSVPFDPDDSAIISQFGETEYGFWHETTKDYPEAYADVYAQNMFHEAFFDFEFENHEREAMHEILEDYFWEEYELDFDELFDWEGYREWYG